LPAAGGRGAVQCDAARAGWVAGRQGISREEVGAVKTRRASASNTGGRTTKTANETTATSATNMMVSTIIDKFLVSSGPDATPASAERRTLSPAMADELTSSIWVPAACALLVVASVACTAHSPAPAAAP